MAYVYVVTIFIAVVLHIIKGLLCVCVCVCACACACACVCVISDNAFQQNVRRKCLFLQIAAKILKLVSADDQVSLTVMYLLSFCRIFQRSRFFPTWCMSVNCSNTRINCWYEYFHFQNL